MKYSRAAIVAAVIACGAGLVAVSDAADAYSDRVRRACTGDYKRLCGQYKANSPQVRSCMEANAFSISGPCVSALVDSGEVDGTKVKRRY
jgi:pyruvate dehydrogenase complex dehydrogenase (E1) component